MNSDTPASTPATLGSAAIKLHRLSKSKMLSFRQCAKKLYLEVTRPELIPPNPALQRVFDQGHHVGDKAQELYGPGTVINIRHGARQAVEQTRQLLQGGYRQPIYEAAFVHDEVLVLADVVIPGDQCLRVIEVKSSTRVKDENLFDCAVQSWVMRGAGYAPASVSVAHINNEFVYQGDSNYQGLLHEVPVDAEIAELISTVPALVASAKRTLDGPEPSIEMGPHCDAPYECPFQDHCGGPPTAYPVHTLPRISKARWVLEKEGYKDIRDIPEGRLSNPDHLRVWRAARTGKTQLDARAAELIRALPYPRYYLDFETIQFAVPIWAGTRPFEQLPFQWACKIERAPNTEAEHAEFLDLSGKPPMRACAEQLIQTLGSSGAIMVYSGFEARVIKDLAKRYKDLAKPLNALLPRLADLLPIVRAHYYDPRMAGSWSIKKVLPTVAPELDYGQLEGVRDGGEAQAAYLRAISLPPTDELNLLKQHLLRYCGLDAEAMTSVARFLSRAEL